MNENLNGAPRDLFDFPPCDYSCDLYAIKRNKVFDVIMCVENAR